MAVVQLDDHRECDALFDLRVYRHPNGTLIVGPIDAFDAWFAETPGQTNVERMIAIADLMPEMAAALRDTAQSIREDGQEHT